MSTVPHHAKGTPHPIYRVRVQPTGRGPIWVGDYVDKAEARRADDAARMWLFDLHMLRCSLSTGWHQPRLVYQVLGTRTAPLPQCPARLAAWLHKRGWKIPGYDPNPAPIDRRPPTQIVDEYLRRLAAIEYRIAKLEAMEQPPATEEAGTESFLI